MSGEELKAADCPFCGSIMEGPHTSDAGVVYWMHPGVVTDDDCFMSGQGVFPRQLKLWNRRAALSTPPIVGEDVQALMEAAQRVLDGGYVSEHIEEERGDHLALKQALVSLSSPPPAVTSQSVGLREALENVRHWVASLTVTDMNEIVADNGITAGMVVGQEANEQLRRIDAALAEPASPPPVGEQGAWPENLAEIIEAELNGWKGANGGIYAIHAAALGVSIKLRARASQSHDKGLREALRAIASLRQHSREDDADNAATMEDIARRALSTTERGRG